MKRRFPLLAKLGALALVGAMVLGCLARIEGLVGERGARREAAAQEVERSHAGAQTLVGPLLQRRCSETWSETTGTGKDAKVEEKKRDFTLDAVPATLGVAGKVRADPLHRGIYQVNAYVAHMDVEADFAAPATTMLPTAAHQDGRLQCDAPTLYVALSDVRGVRAATLAADGSALEVHPGTTSERHPRGFSAALPAARGEGAGAAAPLHVKLGLELIGTRQLAWVPAAEAVHWTVASDWPHPSFGGKFLPDARDVRGDGFDATWNLSALASTASADALRGGSLCEMADEDTGLGYASRPEAADDAPTHNRGCLDTMAVAFIDPVNPYVLSDRAVKYASLFLLVTFAAVGLVEVLTGRRVHPMQYLLVGFALSLFFLLLLSLSEHLPFEQAYAAAAGGCALLLGAYASAIFGHWSGGLAFGAAIGALYGLLYTLLRLEQNSLVLGSLMLFAGLAVVMWLTRRIDWYALFARLRAGSEPAAVAQPGES